MQPENTSDGKASERSSLDAIIELYMKDVDVGLLEENLKLKPQQRLDKLWQMQKFAAELRKAGEELRQR